MFNNTDYNEITLKLKEEIKNKLSETPRIYELWFEDMSVLRMTDKVLLISVNTDIQKRNIESKYKHLLIDAIKAKYFINDLIIGVYYTQNGPEKMKITKETMDADERRLLLDDIGDIETPQSVLHTDADKSAAPQTTAMTQKAEDIIKEIDSDDDTDRNVKFTYTFENFIVGSSNRFAYKACTVVAESPAIKYNPFFIYGSSGLGKTHLLCAIYNEYSKKFKNAKVIYVNGEDFANELIDLLALKDRHKIQAFKEKYRTCDMLLIDDIHFIAGKPSTQEEIFHTFNALYDAGKQIIFTSDRPPKDMKTLEERLTSRFEWGLMADIQPPEIELKIAILKRKSEDMNIKITNDVLEFLANHISSNIRQIEGAIKKLNAYSLLNNQTITLELAKTSIAYILSGTEPINVTVEKILGAVSQMFGVPQTELKGRKRSKEIAFARNVAIYIIRSVTDMSLHAIGRAFDRNHTTILSATKVIENEMKTNLNLANQITEISNIAKA
ncbi:MAG: chromosomal replication initiator protein DnaA [Oscillospiraceae bacterium]|nr:chromosomal replication initiator protein DnaA [Oscillospiraceae bacterium]